MTRCPPAAKTKLRARKLRPLTSRINDYQSKRLSRLDWPFGVLAAAQPMNCSTDLLIEHPREAVRRKLRLSQCYWLVIGQPNPLKFIGLALFSDYQLLENIIQARQLNRRHRLSARYDVIAMQRFRQTNEQGEVANDLGLPEVTPSFRPIARVTSPSDSTMEKTSGQPAQPELLSEIAHGGNFARRPPSLASIRPCSICP